MDLIKQQADLVTEYNKLVNLSVEEDIANNSEHSVIKDSSTESFINEEGNSITDIKTYTQGVLSSVVRKIEKNSENKQNEIISESYNVDKEGNWILTECSEQVYQNDGTLNFKNVKKYDENCKIIFEIQEYYSKEGSGSKYEINYGENGNRCEIKQTSYDANGYITLIVDDKRTSKGQKISTVSANYKNGKKIDETQIYYNDNGTYTKYEIEYRDNGSRSKIKQALCDVQGNLISIVDSKLDKEGQKISTVTENFQSRKKNNETHINYNEDGSYSKFEVKYDANGNRNESKQTTYDAKGNIISVVDDKRDKNGKKISSIIENYSNGKKYDETQVFNNIGGTRTMFEIQYAENGCKTDVKQSTYDSQGIIASIIENKRQENGQKISTVADNYENGKKANSSQIYYYPDGAYTKILISYKYDNTGNLSDTSMKTYYYDKNDKLLGSEN